MALSLRLDVLARCGNRGFVGANRAAGVAVRGVEPDVEVGRDDVGGGADRKEWKQPAIGSLTDLLGAGDGFGRCRVDSRHDRVSLPLLLRMANHVQSVSEQDDEIEGRLFTERAGQAEMVAQ